MGTDTFHFQAEQANLTRRGISSSETTNIFKLAQATVPEESNFSWQALQRTGGQDPHPEDGNDDGLPASSEEL
eukprot:7442065-Pyramimonas_sp.AAC.1